MNKLFSFLFLILVLNAAVITAQTKSVTIDQKLSDNSSSGAVGLWNTTLNLFDDYSVPQTFNWTIGDSKTLRGFQDILSNEKYNHWINNTTNENGVTNHKSFTIYPNTNDLISKFHPTNPGVTIKTSLEGTSSTGGVIEFRDPWFIDLQDAQYDNQLRNRGMIDAVPRQRTSPFYPDATTQYEFGQKYNGVFLDQDPATTPTYYKVGVPEEQLITIHGQNRKFYPYYWTGSGVNYQNENDRETGIVFTQGNANATAVLKGELMSNDQNGISNNSQKKLVQTINGLYHLVYESQGNVWLCSFVTGITEKEVLLKTNAKNPSIDYFNDIITIVYEYWDNELKLGFKQINTNCYPAIIYDTTFTLSNNSNDLGITSNYNRLPVTKGRTCNLKSLRYTWKRSGYACG